METGSLVALIHLFLQLKNSIPKNLVSAAFLDKV